MTKIIKPVHNNRHKNRFHHNFHKDVKQFNVIKKL